MIKEKQLTMKKEDLIEAISKDLNIFKADITAIINKLVEKITEEVTKGTKVYISGLGTFARVYKKAREGINPSTREKIDIPEKHAPKFTLAKGFKAAVASAF